MTFPIYGKIKNVANHQPALNHKKNEKMFGSLQVMTSHDLSTNALWKGKTTRHLHGVYSPISLLYKQPRAAPNDVQIPYTMVSVGVFFIMNRGTGIVAIEKIIEEREHIHLATMPLVYYSEKLRNILQS
jgi:hypothetical protein